ncbi:MAG: 50S ribosomal protein L18 [Planctomycetota bacterium]|jgi:large subunit ribosomal protein L18|nr:50S ribosomal protein L18 [Planctomycetota bacterium]MDP6988250.1 50S ribosomal protein L18 [Planctomycetota bacterium]
MNKAQKKNATRLRRCRSVGKRVRRGTTRRRLAVNRSLKHISGQVIDDAEGKTLCGVSSTAKGLAAELSGKTKTEQARIVGAEMARRAVAAGVEEVVFDRRGSKYHGRVKAFADAAREAGLKF